MTSADTEAMKALQELLDERQRYEGWMRALDERRDTTPPNVFSRVQTDYSLRLERVMLRLSERTEQVRATVDAMTDRLSTLRSKETERIDARQEAELRAAVGEYSNDEWTRLRDEADLEIELLAQERGGVEEELAEMQRIMEMTQPSAPRQTPAAQESSAPAVATPQAVTSQSATAANGSSNPSTTETAVTPEDAPSIEDFVADWPVRHVDPTPAAHNDGVAEVSEAGEPASVASAGTSSLAAMVAPIAPHADAPVAEHRHEEKTLKCPECSALNYATEWYCERCGGELATF